MEENIEVRDEAFCEALVLSRISRYFVETKDMPQVEVKDLLRLPSFMRPASTRAAAARPGHAALRLRYVLQHAGGG